MLMQRLHMYKLRVAGPTVVETLLPLALGLFVGAVAAGAAAFARGARREAAA